jgi:hypothetical protein
VEFITVYWMGQSRLFIILDAARIGADIETAKNLNADCISLFRGSSEESLEMVAPYLFSFSPGSEFIIWFLNKGWGDSWGILFSSTEDQNMLVSHFQKLIFEKTMDRGNFYFRFYDPRVLRVFLQTCNSQQLSDFFGPVDCFVCEDGDQNTGLIFSLHNGELIIEKIKKDEVITFHPEIKKRKS